MTALSSHLGFGRQAFDGPVRRGGHSEVEESLAGDSTSLPARTRPSEEGLRSRAVGTAGPIGATLSSSSTEPAFSVQPSSVSAQPSSASELSLPSVQRSSSSPSGNQQDYSNPFGANGWFAQMAEYIPFVNGGLQRLHEYNGDNEACSRARARDPLGADGYLMQAAEYTPLVNSLVQETHRMAGDTQAATRARKRNPIGTNGFMTKVVEHIPLFSDGVRALHQYQGDEMAAERARTHSLQKLLSKDGAITRLAELLPVSNLFAAAIHELHGNHNEAIRALDLIDSWAQAVQADGLFTKVAELLPGADAVAFAIHVQGGYYAQAIRSITKVAWVNVEIAQVTLYINFVDFSRVNAKDMDAVNLEIIPRQLSLLVGMSDMLTNFLRIDREGHRRSLSVRMEQFSAGGNTMLLTKELLKAIIDEKLTRRVECLKAEVPNYLDWLVEVLNRWVPVWRRRRLMMRTMSPKSLPRMSAALKEEMQRAVPAIAAMAGELPPVGPVPRRRTLRGSRLTEAAAATGCLAFAAGGLGLKAVGVACIAGALAGTAALGRAAARLALSWMDEWNEECWSNVTRQPQPEPPAWQQEAERAAERAAKERRPPPDEQPRPSSRPGSPGDQRPSAAREPSPQSAASASGDAQPTAGEPRDAAPHGLVLEFAAADTARLAGLVRRYYFEDVLRGSLRGFLLRLVEPTIRAFFRSVIETEGTVQPVVFELELEEWEVELDGYSWNLRLPGMRFAMVFHFSWESGVPRCTRCFAALPDELQQNLVRCLRAQMHSWDLRELDPRFAGFTKPVHTAFTMGHEWTSENVLRLDAYDVRSRLDLPD